MNKIILFEYFLKKIVEWYCKYYQISWEEFNSHSENDLSKLKVIKLHFFSCSTTESALEIFDTFHAMPYGHVESDVYKKLDELQFCIITNRKLIIKNISSFKEYLPESYNIIDDSVEKLIKANPALITIDPFELVELSHRWFSWRYNFHNARLKGDYSKRISKDLILKEEKIYTIV